MLRQTYIGECIVFKIHRSNTRFYVILCETLHALEVADKPHHIPNSLNVIFSIFSTLLLFSQLLLPTVMNMGFIMEFSFLSLNRYRFKYLSSSYI